MAKQDDPIFPEAGHINGTSVVGTTESPGVTEADPPTAEQPQRSDSTGLRPGFLSELANAMRATAERERETIARASRGPAATSESPRSPRSRPRIKRPPRGCRPHQRCEERGGAHRSERPEDLRSAGQPGRLPPQHDAIIEERSKASTRGCGVRHDARSVLPELSGQGPAAIVGARGLPPRRSDHVRSGALKRGGDVRGGRCGVEPNSRCGARG